MPEQEKAEVESGGSSQEQFEVQDEGQPIGEAISEEMEEPEEINQALVQVNEAMIEVSAKTIGKFVALLTKIPEMDFTEDELQQLKNLWNPIVPIMSPVVGAIIGTSIIVSGKVGVYFTLKGGKKVAERAAKEQSDEVPPTTD